MRFWDEVDQHMVLQIMVVSLENSLVKFRRQRSFVRQWQWGPENMESMQEKNMAVESGNTQKG